MLKKTLPLVAALITLGTIQAPDQAKAGDKREGGSHLQRSGASWYGPGFQGRKTASGERFNTHAMTAAHRSLPFGTRVKVVNVTNGRSVVVRINDRGPFHRGRVIDLARAPANVIGMGGTTVVALYRAD